MLKAIRDKLGLRSGDNDQPLDPITRMLVLTLAIAAIVAIIGFWFYNRVHMFDSWRILTSVSKSDTEGTNYVLLGDRIIKYSHDGLFCVNLKNETLWSAAYSMQTPISEVCGGDMVIAEQQGTQVYVLDRKGVIGTFSTTLPILRAHVASNGVVLLLLKDDDVTWVCLYDSSGNELAAVKTTIDDTGYPLAAAMTGNAKRVLVSYVEIEGSELSTRLILYDFSSTSDEEHEVASLTYENEIFPEVFFADAKTPAAVGDQGCVVLTDEGKEKTRITFEEEIVSTVHDEGTIAFIFHSDATDARYELQAYNYKGRQILNLEFDFEYTDIKMNDDEIIFYDTSEVNIYRTSGKQKLSTRYDKEITSFDPLSGFHKYLVVTEDSIDQIRIE